MSSNEVRSPRTSKSISIPNSSSSTLTNVIAATESQSGTLARAAAKIAASSVRLGKTTRKHCANRSFDSSIEFVHLVVEFRTLFEKSLPRQRHRPIGLGAEHFREESPQRAVFGCRRKCETHLIDGKALEDRVQAAVFDSAGKSAAAHYPGFDVQCCSVQPALQDCDLSQRPKLILIARCQQKGSWSIQSLPPLRISKSRAVQIELVGLVDQLQR